MNKKKVSLIINILNLIFPNPKISLYYENQFTLLIAVLLSAQSMDKRVNEITPQLFSKANTPYKMLKLHIDKIKLLIKKIGIYNKKAKNIHNISNILVKKYNGKIPKTFKELESLPGIGHKSASIIMSEAFGKSTFPVDTHIHRMMYKWGLSSGRSIKETEKNAKEIFPKKLWNKLHLQIIYYGREYSPARGWKIEKDIILQLINSKKL